MVDGSLPSAVEGGHVLLVSDRRTRRPMVLKLRTLKGSGSWAAWDRCEHEGKVVRSIRHRGVPRYLEHGTTDTLAYLLMARAPGESLQQRLERGERWSDLKLQHILSRALEILAYLHELNPPVFHCDIHPEHVIVSGAGDVTLCSFTRARSLLCDQGDAPFVPRSGYAPDDRSTRPSPFADLYALGATLAAIASGTDASGLPRRGSVIALDRCLKPSLVRDAVEVMLRPGPSATPAAELKRWLARARSQR